MILITKLRKNSRNKWGKKEFACKIQATLTSGI